MLASCNTEAANFFGEFGLSDRDAILDQDAGDVGVDAVAETDVERVATVAGSAAHVDHAFDAVDFLFDGRSDGVGDGLGVCAGVERFHANDGRRELGVLGNGQARVRECAQQHDDDGDNAGEDGPRDEELGEHGAVLRWPGWSGGTRGERGVRG